MKAAKGKAGSIRESCIFVYRSPTMGKPDNLIVSRIKLGVALEGLKLDKRKETRCPNHKGISLSAQASLIPK